MELKIETETIYGSSEDQVENRIHDFFDSPGTRYKGVEYYRENDNSFAAVVFYYGTPEYT